MSNTLKYKVEIGDKSNSFVCISEEFKYSTQNHKYIKAKCEICGSERIIRNDQFSLHKVNCKNCIYNTRKEGVLLKTVPNWYFKSVCNLAKQRSIPITITLEEIIILWNNQGGKCALSGVDLTFGMELQSLNEKSRLIHSHRMTTASLDRIDSNGGYIKGNIQWVEKNINIFKNALNNDDFIGLCRLVSQYTRNQKVNFDPSFLQGYHKRYSKKKVQRLTPELP